MGNRYDLLDESIESPIDEFIMTSKVPFWESYWSRRVRRLAAHLLRQLSNQWREEPSFSHLSQHIVVAITQKNRTGLESRSTQDWREYRLGHPRTQCQSHVRQDHESYSSFSRKEYKKGDSRIVGLGPALDLLCRPSRNYLPWECSRNSFIPSPSFFRSKIWGGTNSGSRQSLVSILVWVTRVLHSLRIEHLHTRANWRVFMMIRDQFTRALEGFLDEWSISSSA